MSKILVTGATGRLGRQVVEQLMKRIQPGNIRILVRDAEKAAALAAQGVEVCIGNYDDIASLQQAFQGVDKIYLISGNEIEKRDRQHDNVINAAREAGCVKHIFYTSFQRKKDITGTPLAAVAESHQHTEKSLQASGIGYTLLRHALYADIIPDFAGPQVFDTQTLFFPAGNGATTFATSADMAEAGAILLTDKSNRYLNAAVEISGSEAVTWQQIAGILSETGGKTVNYVSPDIATYRAAIEQTGLPPYLINLLIGFAQATADNQFELPGELETILQRKPVTVKEYLINHYR